MLNPASAYAPPKNDATSPRAVSVIVAPKKIGAPPATGTAHTWIASTPLSTVAPPSATQPPIPIVGLTVAPVVGVSIAMRDCGDGPATNTPVESVGSPPAKKPTTSFPVTPSNTRVCGPPPGPDPVMISAWP